MKIAREAVFGEAIMKKCTALGGRGLPGLPSLTSRRQYLICFRLTGRMLKSLKASGLHALKPLVNFASDCEKLEDYLREIV